MRMETIYFLSMILLFVFFLAFLIPRLIRRRQQTENKEVNAPGIITIKAGKVFFGENASVIVTDSVEKDTGTSVKDIALVQTSKTGINPVEISEKRRYQRKNVRTMVDFVKDGRLYKEISKDLSQSGIFLKTRVPNMYKLDDYFTLSFQYSNGEPYKNQGRVVRKNAKGVGIQFIAA